MPTWLISMGQQHQVPRTSGCPWGWQSPVCRGQSHLYASPSGCPGDIYVPSMEDFAIAEARESQLTISEQIVSPGYKARKQDKYAQSSRVNRAFRSHPPWLTAGHLMIHSRLSETSYLAPWSFSLLIYKEQIIKAPALLELS